MKSVVMERCSLTIVTCGQLDIARITREKLESATLE